MTFVVKRRASWRDSLESYLNILLRVGILLAALAAASAMGWFIGKSRFDGTLVLGAALGAVGALIGYKLGRYEYGIIAVMLTAGLVNFFSLPTGRESRIVISSVIAMALLAIWLFQAYVRRPRIPLLPSAINRPMTAFIVISIIAYVWSIVLRDPMVYVWSSFGNVQIAALLFNIMLVLFALFVANKVTELRWLRWFTWIMILLGTVSAVAIIWQFNAVRSVMWNGTRGLFVMWVGSLAYALALYDDELAWWKRAGLLGVLGLNLYWYFYVTISWVTGWLPLGISCVIITYQRSKKLFLLFSMIGLMFVALNADAVLQTIANEENEGSSERPNLWLTNLGHVARHPLFGMGPAGYAVYNMTYNPGDARSTHNNYFDIVAQTGITGFVAFLWMMVAFIRTGQQNLRMAAKRRDFVEAFANATFAGTIAACAGMMLGDWVLPFAYNQTITGFDNAVYTWLFMGGMIGLNHILKRRESPPEALKS